jgi:hypothetical protein
VSAQVYSRIRNSRSVVLLNWGDVSVSSMLVVGLDGCDDKLELLMRVNKDAKLGPIRG